MKFYNEYEPRVYIISSFDLIIDSNVNISPNIDTNSIKTTMILNSISYCYSTPLSPSVLSSVVEIHDIPMI